MKPIMTWEQFNSKRKEAFDLHRKYKNVDTYDLYVILGINTDIIATHKEYSSWAEIEAALRAFAEHHYTIVGGPEVEQKLQNTINNHLNSLETINLTWDSNHGYYWMDKSEHNKLHEQAQQTPPIPVNMWITPGGYTTVQWEDGTKTTVKAEGENATEYGGFCACVVKKLYGSTTCGLKQMQKAIDGANWPKRKKEIEREKQKAYKREMAERRKRRLEEKIRFEIEQIKVKREAERRLNESEEKMMYE